jgi:putative glycosyltransferase (TIGR04348 family)
MQITMITPAPAGSKAGNRATAARWARILRGQGHHVRVAVEYDGKSCDLMVALHAWRSAAALRQFKALHPDQPLVLALTGTDLYRFALSDPETTLQSMRLADRLVVLHAKAHAAIPQEFHARVQVIYQSAKPLARVYPKSKRFFDVCVAGHLREEKDSLRAAYATRSLPRRSRIRVVHVGKAHSEDWVRAARAEMRHNPRYQWLGEVPHWRVRELMGRSHLMVLSSRMEGGANVISEAVAARLPVIASHIDGSVGLLGEDYPGYYPVEDTEALSALLLRAEQDTAFYSHLRLACDARAHLFYPENEEEGWGQLIQALARPSPRDGR